MSPVARKSDILKIADDLGAKSRILRRAVEAEQADPAEGIDETVQRLATLAAEHHTSEQNARDTQAAEIRARYAPLIEKAERVLADNAAVVAEVSPLIRRLADLDWTAIRTRARNSLVAGSLHSTHTVLSVLQRAVEEAAVLLRYDGSDLLRWLGEVKSITGMERHEDSAYPEQQREYAQNGLTATMTALRASTDVLRTKAGAIRALLAAVRKDLDVTDAAMVGEAK